MHRSAVPRPSPVGLYRPRDADGGAPRLHASGRHVRVRRGVYASRDAWAPLAPWDRYLARVHAYALVAPDAVFAYESAAALRGLPIFGEPRDIHVFDSRRSSSRRFGDVCVHTGVDGREIETMDGLRLTAAADTALDLMRVLPPAFGLAVADAVASRARGGGIPLGDLEALATDQTHRRGRARLRLLLPMVDARSESPGESVSRAVIVWAGFEAPELQVVVRSEGHEDRVDFGWPSVRALGEADGYGKYLAETPEETVERVIREKRREDRLRRRCAAFGRWDMSDALAVEPLVARLTAMRVPRVAHPRLHLLSTLGGNPRSVRPGR